MPEEIQPKLAKINFRADDKIGLPNYSSITYGLSISRDVEDTGLEDVMKEAKALAVAVEDFLAEERTEILKLIQGQTAVQK